MEGYTALEQTKFYHQDMINYNNCIYSDRTRCLSMSCIFIILCCRFPHTHLRVNPCGGHVNPRSVEWIISMIFSLFRFWRMVAVTRTSSTLYSQFLCTQCAELAGYESEIKFLFFFELFSSVIFSFLLFGVQGGEPYCKLCIAAFNFQKL